MENSFVNFLKQSELPLWLMVRRFQGCGAGPRGAKIAACTEHRVRRAEASFINRGDLHSHQQQFFLYHLHNSDSWPQTYRCVWHTWMQWKCCLSAIISHFLYKNNRIRIQFTVLSDRENLETWEKKEPLAFLVLEACRFVLYRYFLSCPWSLFVQWISGVVFWRQLLRIPSQYSLRAF